MNDTDTTYPPDPFARATPQRDAVQAAAPARAASERLTSNFAQQAQERCGRYRAALREHGFGPQGRHSFVAVVTTDLPGEILRLALVSSRGTVRHWDFKPVGPISAGAKRHHGLSAEAFADAPLFAQRLDEVLGALQEAAPLAAWNGGFVKEALDNSAGVQLDLEIASMQDVIDGVNTQHDPLRRYPPSLDGMRWTVPVPQFAPDNAVQAALAARAALHHIQQGKAATEPPRRS